MVLAQEKHTQAGLKFESLASRSVFSKTNLGFTSTLRGYHYWIPGSLSTNHICQTRKQNQLKGSQLSSVQKLKVNRGKKAYRNFINKGLNSVLDTRYLQPQIKQHRKSWQVAEFSLKGYLDQIVLVLPYLTGVSENLCTGAL